MVTATAIAVAIKETQKSNDESGNYYVYVLMDVSKNVQYVGRTKDPVARKNAHKANPFRKGLDFTIVASDLSYEQARGLEQTLMLYYHTLNPGNQTNNQINGISYNNDAKDIYIKKAEGILGYLWNQVSNDVLSWAE